jgi:uncharacterized membrane protein YukC
MRKGRADMKQTVEYLQSKVPQSRVVLVEYQIYRIQRVIGNGFGIIQLYFRDFFVFLFFFVVTLSLSIV